MALQIDDYDVLIRPIVTEKALSSSSHYQQFVFEVSKRATKTLVKKVIEALFDVKVKYVNILRRKGKQKHFKGFLGRQREMKKAIICLEAGYTIDLAGL